MGALTGIRVRICLPPSGGVCGRYAAWLLSGLGASVELHGAADAALPAVSRWLQHGLPLRLFTTRPALRELAGSGTDCDALLVDYGSRLGAGDAAEFDALERSHPALVALAVSPFGLTGPWSLQAAGQQEIQALSGLMHATGDAGEPPRAVAGHVVDMACGVNAAIGLLLGLWRRRAKGNAGGGALIDVSALETIVGLQASRILAYAYTGLVYRRNNAENLNNFLPCADGYLHLTLWGRPFAEMLGFLDIDPSTLPAEVLGIADQGQLFAHPKILEAVKTALSRATRREWMERGRAARVPTIPVYRPEELLDDPHLAERGFFDSIEIDGRSMRVPSYPFKSAGLWGPDTAATPNAAVPAGKAGVPAGTGAAGAGAPAAPAAGANKPCASDLPLSGVRVIEVGLAWSAPMAAQFLAMYGAEVIKLESPTRLDTARSLPTLDLELRQPWWEYTYNYHPVNAGKAHFGFNVTGPSGGRVRERLLKRSDIVLTNYSVRALTNLGLDGAAIRKVNPRCSAVHSTGFGWNGPYRDLLAYGTGMEGMTGVAQATGAAIPFTASADTPPGPPVRSPLLHPDIFAALHQVLAALACLFRREATGEGSVVDLGQIECGGVSMFQALAEAQGAERQGNMQSLLLPCKGEDEWISITLDAPAQCRGLMAALQLESAGESFDALRASANMLSAAARRHDKRELALALQARGIAAQPVLAPDEVLLCEQLRERDYFTHVDSPDFGPRLSIGRWHRFKGMRQARFDAPHRFGADNETVLRQTLAFSAEEAAVILSDGTVGEFSAEAPSPPAGSSPVDWMVATQQIYRHDADFKTRLGLLGKD